MARQTTRRVTERAAESQDRRPPQLQQNRRFYTSGGFSDGVRAARALENAFKVGTQFAGEQLDEANRRGTESAVVARAAGEDRDLDEANKGYNDAWDQLDAEYDLNLLKKELPEILRGADWEEMDEAQVQQLITQTMQEQFGGIDNLGDSEYAKYMAPRLLELETTTIAAHRDMQIEKIHEEQRSKIYANAKEQLDADGALDYETLFKRTGTFFDGSTKKTVYWESVFDLAIEAGDPGIIEDMPAEINGIPTGINDPAMQDQIRAATNQAYAKLAKREAAAEALAEAQNEQMIFDTQLAIANKVIAGEPVNNEIGQLRSLGASFSDLSSSMNFGSSTRTTLEKRAVREVELAGLYSDIYSGDAGMSDVMRAFTDGTFGAGEQSAALLKSTMAMVEQQRKAAQSGNASTIGAFRSEITGRYNPATEGLLKGLDPGMLHIRTQAVTEYNDMVLNQGVAPADARQRVYEKFDPLVSENTANARSQSEFAAEARTIPVSAFKQYAAGQGGAATILQGQTRASIEEQLDAHLRAGDLTVHEATKIITDLIN